MARRELLCLLSLLVLTAAQRGINVASIEDLEAALEDISNGDIIDITTPRLNLTSSLSLTARDISIRGIPDGTTLVCPSDAGGLFVSGRRTLLQNLRFIECQIGPAVVIEGGNLSRVDVTLRNIRFEDNTFSPSTRFSRDGEPSPLASPLFIRRCRISTCQTNVTVLIENATFSNNSADSGGAISISDAAVTIRSSEFVDNSGRISGGAVYVRGPGSTVTISNCSFARNLVLQSGQHREILGTSTGLPLEIVAYWTFPFPTAKGGAIDIHEASNVEIINSRFQRNSAPAGGGIAIQVDIFLIQEEEQLNRRQMIISGCTFQNNTAQYSPTAIEAGGTDEDRNLGGSLYIVSNSQNFHFEVVDSVFIRNVARFGGAMHVVTRMETVPVIEESRFEENVATEAGGGIFLRNTGMVDFRTSNCSHNHAVLGGCLLLTNNAELEVEGLAGIGDDRQGTPVFFVNNTAVNGGAIACVACRNVILREPAFINNTAADGGGAVYVVESQSSFSIEQVTFQGNLAYKGGALAVSAAGSVSVSGNLGLIGRFVQNVAISGGAIHVDANSQRHNRLQVVNSVFENNEAIDVDAFLIDRRVIEAFNLLTAAGHLNISLEEWEDDLRSGVSACGEGGGGGICLLLQNIPPRSVADYVIQGSRVQRNRAVVGGGVYLAVTGSPLWNADNNAVGRCPINVQFDPCRALRFTNVTVEGNVASAGAGGIFINTPSTLMFQCTTTSDGMTMSEAVEDGQSELNETDFCGFVFGNTVEEMGFGPNFAANVDTIDIEPKHTNISNHTSGARLLPDCPGCPVNRTEGILVRVKDPFNQVITGGIADANLAVNLISQRILGERRYIADRGIININNTQGIGIDISLATVRIESVPDGSLFTQMTFSTRACYPGEEQGDLECDVCNPLQYAFNPEVSGCLPCEDRAVCTGGAALVPIDGFWHSTPFSPQLHECIIKRACSYDERINNLSGYYADRSLLERRLRTLNETIQSGVVPRDFPEYRQCAEGYKGILCGSCEDGYGHFAGGECVNCPTNTTGSIFISISISIWMAVFIGINILAANSSIRRQIRLVLYTETLGSIQQEMTAVPLENVQRSGPSASMPLQPTEGDMRARITSMIKLTETMKILVNYLQVTSVALSINLNWLGSIETLLGLEMTLVGVSSGSRFVPLDCTFNDQDNNSGNPNSIRVLWFRATFPLIVLAFFVLVACLTTLRNRYSQASNENSHTPLSQYITFPSRVSVIVVVVLFFSYNSITSEFMRTVNCIKVDKASTGHLYDMYAVGTKERIWAEDTELYCFKGDHTATGVFGILGLVFFSFGVILLIVLGLTNNEQHLSTPSFIARFGFIYQGYKEQWYTTAWEAVVTTRKALVSAAVVYAFPLGPNLQGVCALGVLMVALTLHFIFAPFKDFSGTRNVPTYSGQMLRTFKLDKWADSWIKMHDSITLNVLEAASLMMSIVVFYAGIVFNDDNTSETGKRTMAVFTLIVNIAFFLYVLYRLYYGAHVAVDQHCQHLKNHTTTRGAVLEGEGIVGLLKKAFTIYRHRRLFETDGANRISRRRFEERI